METCGICNIEKYNIPKLSNHIRRIHKVKFKNYYDEFKKFENDDKYHLDHKISVLYYFINKISPEILSSGYNLEILQSTKNLQKHSKYSISLEQLLKLISSDKEGEIKI